MLVECGLISWNHYRKHYVKVPESETSQAQYAFGGQQPDKIAETTHKQKYYHLQSGSTRWHRY